MTGRGGIDDNRVESGAPSPVILVLFEVPDLAQDEDVFEPWCGRCYVVDEVSAAKSS